MVQFTTPQTILQSQTEAVLAKLPAVLDGDADGVHDARVATRRIREVLPLTVEWHRRDIDELSARFRRIGRALGRVRDHDVRMALLSYAEAHVPSAAPSLVFIRRQREGKRLRAMRKLIKRFERLEVDRTLRMLLHHTWRQFHPWTSVRGSWRVELARSLAQRAIAAREAIHHTTGVYFPNRAHATRIALKKFRYLAEIGEQTGVGTIDDSIRELKKGQDILGDLRDRQVLIDKLPKMATPEHPEISGEDVRLIVQALEAECRELHREYLWRRTRLVEICTHVEQSFGIRRAASGATIAAGVVALSSAAYAWRRRSATKDAGREEVGLHAALRSSSNTTQTSTASCCRDLFPRA